MRLERGRALVLGALLLAGVPARAQEPSPSPSPSAVEEKPSKFRSPEDGWFDVGAFLEEKYGFVPVLVPITEPAVGYGGALGLTFIGKPREGAMARPSITAVVGALTENGTWAVGGADLRHLMDDRIQTLVAVVNGSVNLDFHGLGGDDVLAGRALAYNLEPAGGVAQAKYRLGASRVWIGLNYTYAKTDVAFDVPDDPGVPTTARTSRIGGLTPSLTWDSRDTLFTPGRGTYVELSGGFFGSALGGDDSFQRATLVAMQFLPLHRDLTLGLRTDAEMSFGDMPFYLRPYVALRGAPILRYQGENAARLEGELRWQFWKRVSLVGFAGTGAAWNEGDDEKQDVTTGGAGARYELARKYKLHMGVDVAFGPDGTAFYVQFGSAWFRP